MRAWGGSSCWVELAWRGYPWRFSIHFLGGRMLHREECIAHSEEEEALLSPISRDN
jgi:hypothetical protein